MATISDIAVPSLGCIPVAVGVITDVGCLVSETSIAIGGCIS